jgi:L-amino acid N-acyltransferase YncA
MFPRDTISTSHVLRRNRPSRYALALASPEFAMLIRNVTDADLNSIQAIYAHWVTTGTASFELEAPSVEEMRARRANVIDKGWPYIVAEVEGQVVGYAYAGAFRVRPAYRFLVEHSVYVHPDARRGGIARLLLAELVVRCEQAGARQMIAVIGNSGNTASIGLHRAMGFEHIGTIKSAGWKFDQWLDVVLMQRTLGTGDTQPPQIR